MRRALVLSVVLFTFSLASLAAVTTYYLDTLIHTGIETLGSKLTGTEVLVGEVRASLPRGQLQLIEFRVRNPEGYELQNAFMADLIRIRIRWSSLLTDTIEIEEIYVHKPTLVYEGVLRNNLTKINRSIESYSATGTSTVKKRVRSNSDRTYRIGRFRMQKGEIVIGPRVLGRKKGVILDMPEIDLRNVGGKKEGTHLKEIVSQLSGSVSRQAAAAVMKTGMRQGAQKALKDIKDLLKPE